LKEAQAAAQKLRLQTGSRDAGSARHRRRISIRELSIRQSQMEFLGEGKSIFEGALDLGEERRRQSSQSFNQTPFVDRFDLFGYDLGRKCETSNPFGYDRVTGREMRRVLGQRNDNHELAKLIDTVIGENDHRTGLFDLHANGGVKICDYDITPLYADH
jgi:hypothetical protein